MSRVSKGFQNYRATFNTRSKRVSKPPIGTFNTHSLRACAAPEGGNAPLRGWVCVRYVRVRRARNHIISEILMTKSRRDPSCCRVRMRNSLSETSAHSHSSIVSGWVGVLSSPWVIAAPSIESICLRNRAGFMFSSIRCAFVVVRCDSGAFLATNRMRLGATELIARRDVRVQRSEFVRTM